jgi:regulatory protein
LAVQILEKLHASRYAGDQIFAREWTRGRAESRGYGPLRIEQELRAKGIGDALILEILHEIFAGDYERRKAMEILQKQFGREKLADPRILRRAAAFLQRRGYSETVIQDILGQYEY